MPNGLKGFQKGHPSFIKKGSLMGRIPWNKGIKKPYPSCNDCGKKLKSRKAKLCKSCSNGYHLRGKISPNRGKKYIVNMTSEQRKHRSDISRGRKMSLEARAKIRKWHLENPNTKFKDTGIELKTEKYLIDNKINYQKQVPLCGIARVDFYLPEYRIVIQCDGCFWHNCPIHYPSHHIEQKIKDNKKDSILQFNGYKVYRFWEHEINQSIEECFKRIEFF